METVLQLKKEKKNLAVTSSLVCDSMKKCFKSVVQMHDSLFWFRAEHRYKGKNAHKDKDKKTLRESTQIVMNKNVEIWFRL